MKKISCVQLRSSIYAIVYLSLRNRKNKRTQKKNDEDREGMESDTQGEMRQTKWEYERRMHRVRD